MHKIRVLITGATGYIGRRLKTKLLHYPDLQVRVFVRNALKVQEKNRQQIEIVEGDTFNLEKLALALEDIDVAFYLIHSMGAEKDFSDLDRRSAENFRDACIAAGVKKIIYLGGLGVKDTASKHLLSRIETGEILSTRQDQITTIWLRAGIIIGAGSKSFEILRNLVQKLPIMVTPKWVTTRTQPIAVDDVLAYLAAAIRLDIRENIIVDIGAEIMNFKSMMLAAAEVMGLHRFILPLPVLTPKLSSYWLILFTPVPYKIAAALVEGLRSETIQQNDNATRYFPGIRPLSFADSVRRAIKETEVEEVISRWCDSSAGEACDLVDHDGPASAIIRDRREVDFGNLDPAKESLSEHLGRGGF